MLAHLRIKQIYSKAGRLHASNNRLYPHWVVASRASISNIENRNSWCAAIPEHIEYAKLSGGQKWEFQAGAMARLASGSIVLNTNEDNAILGTVVCKYSERMFDEAEEEKLLDEAEEAVAIEQFEEEGRERLERETRNENDTIKEEDEEAIDEVGGKKMSEKTTRNKRKQESGGEQESSSTQSLPQTQGLTVDFRQSAAALGRIPMNYFRRELQHSDQDVAISRVIDRSIRPIVHPNFTGRTHITCKPLAMNDAGDAIVMGINVASAALAVSPVPQRCFVSACRVAILNGKIKVNPSREQLKNSSLDLVLTGTVNAQKEGDKEAIDNYRLIMIEMEGKEVELDKFVECVNLGFDEIRIIQSAIQSLVNRVGCQKYKVIPEGRENRDELSKHVSACEEGIEEILKEYGHTKHTRGQAIENLFQTWYMLMRRYYKQYSESTLRAAYSELVKKVHRRVVLKTGLRVDGRRPEQFRQMQCRVDLYRKLHGSAIFQRGQSQVLSTVTFDSPLAAFHPDAIAQLLGDQRKKSFMLHYEFPQFATNEIDSIGASKNRREIGHGLLAEKALKQMVPEDFPYTIRLACQVLESNGSTSMASVCAGSMALYDAGVPLLANHVAGIAMGLITEKKEEEEIGEKEEENVGEKEKSKSIPRLPKFPEKYKLLTDLAGFEDYSGDMDFKIAGTSKGFTAMQMDIKICGLPLRVFKEALERSQIGLEHVLMLMRDAIPEPRSDFKPSVPIIELMQLPPYKRPILFRSGAYNAKFIEAETGVKISIEDDSNISLFAPNREHLERAQQMITKMMEQQQDEHYQFGAVYKAEILRIMEGGVQVTLKEGGRPIWIRNMDLSAVPGRKNAISLGLEVGQFLTVQYFGRDQHTGQHRLTRKTLQVLDPPVQNLFKLKEYQQKQEKLEKLKSDFAFKNGSNKNEK